MENVLHVTKNTQWRKESELFSEYHYWVLLLIECSKPLIWFPMKNEMLWHQHLTKSIIIKCKKLNYSIDRHPMCWLYFNYAIRCQSFSTFIASTVKSFIVRKWIMAKKCRLISKVNVKSLEFSLSIIINRTRAAMNVNLLRKELIFSFFFIFFHSLSANNFE